MTIKENELQSDNPLANKYRVQMSLSEVTYDVTNPTILVGIAKKGERPHAYLELNAHEMGAVSFEPATEELIILGSKL